MLRPKIRAARRDGWIRTFLSVLPGKRKGNQLFPFQRLLREAGLIIWLEICSEKTQSSNNLQTLWIPKGSNQEQSTSVQGNSVNNLPADERLDQFCPKEIRNG